MEERKTRPPRNAATTKIKALRVKRGLTQKEVLEKTGLTGSVYTKYEQGVKNIDGAKIETLLKICIALECDIEEIIESEETLKILKKYKEVRENT